MNRPTAARAFLAATALAGSGAALPAVTAQALADDTPGYSVRHILVDVLVGPDRDQPCRITADVYRPDTATRAHKAPAILTTNGFGGAKDDGNQTAVGKGFVKEGYVVLSYSGLGFGGSGCKITLDDPDYDGRAGKQIVDVLAGSRAFTDETTGRAGRIRYVANERPGDPRVGMIGGSYGGEIQFAVAMQDSRVDALIPLITWNDLSYSLAPNNTDLARGVTYRTPGVAKKQWIDLFFGAGIADGVQGASVDPSRLAPPCPNFADQACPSAVQLNTLGYPDPTTLAFARHASVATYVSRVHAPTLLVQGQKDTLFNLQEAVATYRALHRQGTPTRMVWQSWGHSGGTPAPGELDLGDGAMRASYLGRRFLHWMDHYVRGDSSAPVGPVFSYFRSWVPYDTSPDRAGRAVAKAYAERSRFSQRPTASLFFTGTDGLTRSSSKIRSGSASFAVTPAGTSYSETSGLEGSQVNQPPSDAPGTFVAFTSPRLAGGVALVGSPRLTLQLEAPAAATAQGTGPAGKLVLFTKLYDVAPDGTLTLENRLISPVRVRDVTEPVRVQLPAVVHRFGAGHRIRVVVAAGDMAYAGNATSQPVTVTTSGTKPSRLGLPLTGDLQF